MSKRYYIRVWNMQKVCGSHAHNYGNYNSLRTATAKAKQLWKDKAEHHDIYMIKVYDTWTEPGAPAAVVFGIC